MTILPIYRLNRSPLLLLRVVHDYDYPTAVQACRLLFRPTSITYAQVNLKGLADADYPVCLELPKR